VDNLNLNYRLQDKTETRDGVLKLGSTITSQDKKSLAAPAKPELRDYAVSVGVRGTPPASFQRTQDRTIVLEVDSLEDAKKRVAELVVRFDGTLNRAQLSEANATSSQIEVMVPVAKAPEAIDVLKNVLPALSKREEAMALDGSVNRSPSSLKVANEQATGKAGLGGMSGGQALPGGFGGGGAPGTPPGAPSATGGRNIGGGNARGGASPADASARRDRSLKTMSADTQNISALSGSIASAPKASGKKEPKPVLRRIVIVLKKRPPKPNPTDHR